MRETISVGQKENHREKMGEKGTKKLEEKSIFNWQLIVNSSIMFIRANSQKNGKWQMLQKM